MPRLVLLEDDGREVFRGEISRANYHAMLRLFGPHAATVRKVADTVRAVRELLNVAVAPPRPLRAVPRNNRKRGGRA